MNTGETRLTGAPPNATVLIVDDSIEFANVLRSFLEQYRYHAVAVHNGLEALAYLSEQNRVDAILLDVMMQGMDGWETCRWLREITDIPILMLTGLCRGSDLVRGLNLGADDYLVKPFHLNVLKARLEACLRRARVEGDAWIKPSTPLRS
jgi:DNA-binding response OmpR family regulator